MGKTIALNSEFKIVRVPLPLEKVEAWKATLRMLLDWVREEVNKENDCPKAQPLVIDLKSDN